MKSLKVDILDEKFAVTAFITGLGVQSKDLMFSISKNPQASMAEVLAKTDKYINDEEAILSNKRSSSTQKEKSKGYKKRERSIKRQADRDRSPRRSIENRERSPTRRGNIRDRRGPLLRPNDIYKFITLLPKEYCLIPDNGAKNL